ncbi:tetratricopeptide repeat protein [Candidatus Magnetomonas plexicatena]|uniref:tetratricopeptide repeat protein n=1 Tax=Candidatus Magnetomonas plexicatena TaxID=2552947 RepID=UPI001C7876E7|nr:tetratricopeptide repeat protein [Nitrospirales bacterium LBB_01]
MKIKKIQTIINNCTSLLNIKLIKIFVIVILAALAYSNTLNSPFVLDDLNLEKFCQYGNFTEMRFVTETSFVLNCKLHGLKPHGYHIVNILIHIINGLLLFAFSLLTLNVASRKSAAEGSEGMLNENIAFLISLIFTLHPNQIQAVTYIIQRYSSLLTLTYLSSLLFYALSRTNNSKKYVFYTLSLFFALVSTKTKESAITLPVILTAYEFLFFEGKLKKRLLFIAPFFVIIPLILLNLGNFGIHADLSKVNDFSSIDKSLSYSAVKNPLYVYSSSENFFTQIRAVVTYIKILFFPANQTLIYYYPVSTTFLDFRVILSGIFVLIILGYLVALLFSSFKKTDNVNNYIFSRLAAFGILWFFINISPQLMVAVKEWVLLQYRAYLPSIGFSFFVGALAFKFSKKLGEKLMLTISLGIAIVLSLTTYINNSNWQSEITLWEDNVRKAPQHPLPYNFLANAYFNKYRYNDALRAAKQAVELNTYDYQSINLTGYIYERLGEVNDAKGAYELAIKTNPLFAPPYINLGNIYASQGHYDEALTLYEKSLQLKSDLAQTYSNIGNIYLKQGALKKALENYKKAIAITPAFATAHNNLGALYLQQGLIDEAVSEFKEALKYQPDYADAFRNLNSIKRSTVPH